MQIVLRRTKQSRDSSGKLILSLPPKELLTRKVNLGQDERTTYSRLLVETRSLLNLWSENLDRAKGGGSMVLTALLRLRQLCCHPCLCPLEVVGAVKALQEQLKAQLNPEAIDRVLTQLDDETTNCPICLSDVAEIVDAVATPCGKESVLFL
jgi:SWI/SNF-related matrix-associated actin-dependent regulator of chromatin subfamily A3